MEKLVPGFVFILMCRKKLDYYVQNDEFLNILFFRFFFYFFIQAGNEIIIKYYANAPPLKFYIIR